MLNIAVQTFHDCNTEKGSHRSRAALYDANFDTGVPPVKPSADAGPSTVVPSPRCADREEWRDPCVSWSGTPHNRYLEINKMLPREGIGANFLRIAWALNRVIAYDLEPVFNGPLLAAHGVGDFGDWVGLTHNPSNEVYDPEGFRSALRQDVPFPAGNGDSWFHDQINRTSVIYTPNIMNVKKIVDWGVPVSPPPSDPHVCPYVRQVLRAQFWSAPRERGRCLSMLPRDSEFPPPMEAMRTTGEPRVGGSVDLDQHYKERRPWVVAVHVRRGDMVRFHHGKRSIPHTFFVEAVRAVLAAISAVDRGARVSVLVFSEAPAEMPELQLPDEKGQPITWDIPRDSCRQLGLRCAQVQFGYRFALCSSKYCVLRKMPLSTLKNQMETLLLVWPIH